MFVFNVKVDLEGKFSDDGITLLFKDENKDSYNFNVKATSRQSAAKI